MLLALGLALAVLGHVSQSLTAHALAIVVATTGVALFLAGPNWVRQAAFPLGFLLFMLPLPRAFVEVVTLDLQQFVAGFASAALALGGVSVYQDGLLLHLPGITLHVDRGCNGVRFLTVLFVVVTAFAHLHLTRGVQRLIVIAVAIPAAILANAFRVTAIVAATQFVGPHAASGWIHDYIGRSLWVAAIAAMFAFTILLGRTERQDLRAA